MWAELGDLANQQRPYDLGVWNVVMTAHGLKLIDTEMQRGLEFTKERLERAQRMVMGTESLDILR